MGPEMDAGVEDLRPAERVPMTRPTLLLTRRWPQPAIDRFVARYERLTRHMLEEMPARADLVLRLDRERRLLSAEGTGGRSQHNRR